MAFFSQIVDCHIGSDRIKIGLTIVLQDIRPA
jgi:hypothetical protein